MPQIELPSLQIPDYQKASFSEADVHSTLFEPDMAALGFPPRTSSQADGGYFVEQRSLALRRPKSHREAGVVERVEAIVAALKDDPVANIASLRDEIEELTFDLFEIGPASRETVPRFYETVGRPVADDQAAAD